MSNIIIQEEQFEPIIEELAELCKAHYAEIALNKEDIPLAPDWDRYIAMENAKMLLLVTARDGVSLVGYSLFFVNWHMHYKHTLFAANDVVFLLPDYRRSSAGINLLRYSEKVLRERGVIKVLWHVKEGVLDFGTVLQKMGYTSEDVAWGKILRNKETR